MLACSIRCFEHLVVSNRSGLLSPRNCYDILIVLLCDCCKTKFLASGGWKRVCQPFSCPCTAEKGSVRRFCSTCLLQESMPFGKSKPPLPTRSLRSLRAAVRSTSSALCLHHAHPFVATEEKRSVSCREAGGLVTVLWSPRIVTIY